MGIALRMRMVRVILLLFLVSPSLQKQLLELGSEVTGEEIIACAGDDVLSCVLADVDESAFDDAVLDLPRGVQVAKQNDIQEPMTRSGMNEAAKSAAYSGQGADAVFSFRGGRVIGNAQYEDGADFVLEPCGEFPGCHVWKEEDTAHMVEDDGGVEVPQDMRSSNLLSDRAASTFRQQGIDDDTTIAEYSIRIYYTQEFAKATTDIPLYMDQVIAELNQGYINSKIPVRAKLFCVEATTLNDEPDTHKLLEKFINYKGTLEALRGSADAAALYYIRSNYCGVGAMDAWRTGGTITANMKACNAEWVLGHEVGHNFGATHDKENANAVYPHGHGAFIKSPFLTIMAYNKAGYNKFVNYYSNPEISFKGASTGSATENNARVIKENRFGFAAVGDESGTCSLPSTSAPVTTTATPVTTTAAPATIKAKCSVKNKLYSGGKRVSKSKVKDEHACEESCFQATNCTYWNFFNRGYVRKNLRRQCILFSGKIRKVTKKKKAFSGAIDQ